MPRISAAFIVLAMVAAGCTPATTATSPTPSAPSATSVTTDACSLARSDVEPVIGSVTSQQAQTTSVPGTTVGMNVTACVFTSSDGLLTFGVTRAQVSRTDFDNAVKQMPGMQAESGIGDAAFSGTISAAGTGVTSFFVLKGSTYFTLQATSRSKDGPALLAALRTVARKVAGTL
jgi:ribosomal protein L27